MPILPASAVGFVVLLAVLPFHRPAWALLGPAAGLPELLFLPALALLVAGRRPRLTAARLALPALLVVGLAPAALGAPDRWRAFVQLGVILYVATLHGGGALLAEAGHREAGLRALAAGALAASVLGLCGVLLETVGWPSLGLAHRYAWMEATPRPVGPTESPTMLAVVALGGWAAAFVLRRGGALGGRGFAAASAVFAATLAATQSRVILAAIAGAGAWLALAGASAGRRRTGVAMALVAVALTAATITWRFVPLRPRWPFVDLAPSPYRVCHEIALRAFADRPFLGVGLEGFHAAWPRYYEPARHDAAYAGGGESLRGLPRDPHGTLQGYLAEGGLPAGAALLVLAWLLWRRARTPEARALLVALAVASVSTDLLTERSTWALLGLVEGALVEIAGGGVSSASARRTPTPSNAPDRPLPG